MGGGFPIYDAHNHLQDGRLQGELGGVWEELGKIALRKCVVNGTREEDWESVTELARRDERVIPSFGLHPWYTRERSEGWLEKLEEQLKGRPAGVGEIGLDKWVEGSDFGDQKRVFAAQWEVAVRLNRPVTVHCLKAWGPLMDFLRDEPAPACGFLLHSFGGSAELVQPLARSGAYFSISGYFAQERKERQREVFKQVPLERLLIETDAPDMLPPQEWNRYLLSDPKANHPANIVAVYEFASELLGMEVEELAGQVEENFRRLFGGLFDQAADDLAGGGETERAGHE